MLLNGFGTYSRGILLMRRRIDDYIVINGKLSVYKVARGLITDRIKKAT